LYDFIQIREADFLGLSILIGNSGGFLLILKRFNDDGAPEVTFGSGNTPFDCLFDAERALRDAKWRPDKPRPKPET
jgi:hypothetical protein